jgi:hypothetical protein
MEDLVLEKFIHEKASHYKEPERKGTPRGKPIGFSRVKYLSSLYMMTNLKQKNIAKKVGVSYGLLRKWNTHKDFKDLVNKHCEEFAELFTAHIKGKHEKRKADGEFLPENIRHTKEIKPPENFFAELRDSQFYGGLLIKKISSAIGSAIKNPDDVSLVYTIILALEHLLVYSVGEYQQSLWGLNILKNEHIKGVKLGLLDRAKEIIHKPNVTKKDKELVVSILSVLEDLEG